MVNYNDENLLKTIRKIAKSNNFSDKIQITWERGSGKCDGFMGEILAINVTDEKSENTLNLVAKISLKDEKCRSYTSVWECYRNEIIAYEEFFPAIEELRHRFNLPGSIQSLAKYYHSSDEETEETLIMENIKILGFRMRPIRELLDEEHVNLILKSYAEIHANSFALKALQPQKFEEIANKNVYVFRAMLDLEIGKSFVEHLASIRNALKEKNFEHFLLDKYAGNMKEILKNQFDFSDEKYTCFTHGDSWSNNMMFRYEIKNDKESLTGVKLLDWQGWSVAPPVLDLMFCLYSSCSKEVLHNFETHINNYYAHFSNTLASYNLDVEKIYPFRVLKEQMKKYIHFPAIFGLMILKIRSFSEDHKVDPVSFSEKESTHFEEALAAEIDVDYLLGHVKNLLDHLDFITNRKYNL